MIVDGQSRLLEAVQRVGVERLVPSDFSMDLFALEEGENPHSDWRRRFDRALIESGTGYTIFLNGGFMEVVLTPFFGLVDAEEGRVQYWGDGDQQLDLTAFDDAAAFVAEATLYPATLNRRVEVAGDEISAVGIARAFQAATGQPLEPISRGSVADGYAELEKLRGEGVPLMRTLPLIYGLPMFSGRAKLRAIENDRFPLVRPKTVEDFFRSQSRQGA